ncbi:MAG: hypothetical protein NTX25_19525 [Proteobacteria bacterium]|nr:hypothetical protein [Pseudomonadota bacterium]
MLVLVLDTSLKGPLVGLADAKRGLILRFDVRQNPQDAVAQLPAIVAGILRQGSVGWDDIEGIIVGTGPGSFTGIKIGLSFVYGLHRARPKLRFYASSALESLARYSQQTFDLWALPATSNQGYYANRTNFGVLNLERGLQAEVLVSFRTILQIRDS